MAFVPISDLIASLEAAQARVEPEMAAVVGTLMQENAAMSKAMLGREDNPGWAPLKPRTIAEKERLGFVNRYSPTDPVYRTGALADSIEAVVHIEPGVVIGEVGSDLAHARTQECGDHNTPPRPFLAPPFAGMEPRAEETFGRLAINLLTPERAR